MLDTTAEEPSGTVYASAIASTVVLFTVFESPTITAIPFSEPTALILYALSTLAFLSSQVIASVDTDSRPPSPTAK